MSTSSKPESDPHRSSADWIHAALAAVGVATIETDPRGRVLSMNAVAEALTGWPLQEAVGQLVTAVFRIENEKTREPVADPVAVVLATGAAVGIANHIRLIARRRRMAPGRLGGADSGRRGSHNRRRLEFPRRR